MSLLEKSCFAYIHPGRKCVILKNNCGCGSACPFRKSKTDYQVAQRKAGWRLSKLSEEMQWYIAGKYYRGERPWRKEKRKVVGG